SPEQIRSPASVDERADLWALGVVLYEVLTGSVPFYAQSQLQLFAQIAESAPFSPSERRPELPSAIDPVILRCLEKEREHRYPDVAAFAAALGPFVTGEAALLPARVARVLGRSESPAPVPVPDVEPASAATGPVTLTAPHPIGVDRTRLDGPL